LGDNDEGIRRDAKRESGESASSRVKMERLNYSFNPAPGVYRAASRKPCCPKKPNLAWAFTDYYSTPSKFGGFGADGRKGKSLH
jgi:hypothetical protein